MRRGDEQVEEVRLVPHGDKADHLLFQFRDQIRIAGRLQVLAFSVLGNRSEILLSSGAAGLKRKDRLKASDQTRDSIRVAVIAWTDVHDAQREQDEPRLRGAQVAAPGSTLTTLDIQENDAVLAVSCSARLGV